MFLLHGKEPAEGELLKSTGEKGHRTGAAVTCLPKGMLYLALSCFLK